MRLLLCFGLTTAAPSAAPPPLLNPGPAFRGAFFFPSADPGRRAFGCLGALGWEAGGPGGGGGLARRKTEGEGMVMASAIWLTPLPPSRLQKRLQKEMLADEWQRGSRECNGIGKRVRVLQHQAKRREVGWCVSLISILRRTAYPPTPHWTSSTVAVAYRRPIVGRQCGQLTLPRTPVVDPGWARTRC